MALAWTGVAQAEVTVTAVDKGYDIDVIGAASTDEVLEAIVSATGVEIKGSPGDTTINESHLRSASLERAIRALLPRAGFVVRSDAEGKPIAIIFMAPSGAGGAPPPADDQLPDDSGVGIPDSGVPDDSVTDTGVPDGTAPEGALPEANSVFPESSIPDAAPPADDGGEPPPDAGSDDPQDGAPGG